MNYKKYNRKTPWSREQQEQLLTSKFFLWLNKSKIKFQKKQNQTPVLSIIMNVYNHGDMIENAIKSILLQSFTDFELIIVNDGSTDDSCNVVEKYQKLDSRVKLFHMPSHQCCGSARNLGIEHAQGEYLRICDADDYYPPNSITALMSKMNSGEFDIVVGNMAFFYSWDNLIIIDRNFTFISEEGYTDNFESIPSLWQPFHYHRILYRKRFLIDNNIKFPQLSRGEDVVFLTEVLVKTNKIATIQNPTYIYHLRTRDRKFNFEQIRDIFKCRLMMTQIFMQAEKRVIAELNIMLLFASKFDILGLPEDQALELAGMILHIYSELPRGKICPERYTPYEIDAGAVENLLKQLENSSPETLLQNLKLGLINFKLGVMTGYYNYKAIREERNKKRQVTVDKTQNSRLWKIPCLLRILKMGMFEPQHFMDKIKNKFTRKEEND